MLGGGAAVNEYSPLLHEATLDDLVEELFRRFETAVVLVANEDRTTRYWNGCYPTAIGLLRSYADAITREFNEAARPIEDD